MAERLPVGAARNTKSPSLSSFGSSPASNEVSNASIDRMNGQAVFQARLKWIKQPVAF